MTYTMLLAAYAVIALLVALHGTVRIVAQGPRRNPRPDLLDEAVAAGTLVLASAAWVLLLAVWAAGWLHSPAGRRALQQLVAGIGKLRPEPIFRERLHQALR